MVRIPRLSAGSRVALALTVAIALGVVLLSGVSYAVFSRQLRTDLDRALLAEAEAYAASLAAVIGQGGENLASASEKYIDARAPGSSAILMVRLEDGRLIGWQASALGGNPENAERLNPAQAYKGFDDLLVQGERYRVATISLQDETSGEVVAVFQAALPTRERDRTAEDLAWALFLTGSIVVFVGAVLSRRAAQTALKPLHQAARTAGHVTYSSLSERVPYNGPQDDVGLLVSSLNSMLDRLESAFAEQRRFVADASHELRTPVTIIAGHLEIMRSEGGLTQEQEETVDLAMDELERMGKLVGDLLSLARLEGGRPPRFDELDLGEVVEEAVARGQGLSKRRLAFTHAGPLPVRGNRDLLLQALLNLLSNAVRHTGEDGQIRVQCRREAQTAAVEVSDNGPGIPLEDLERVFDRFYRSGGGRHRSGGGTGLGLAIARRLVELHGGRLTAGNTPDGGAVFELSLPLLPGH